MTTVCRIFSKDFFVVLALTVLMWLAGVIVLPSLGPTYADSDPAQAQTSDDSSAVQQRVGHGSW